MNQSLLNITSEFTPEEIIIASHKLSGIPSAVIIFITSFIILLIVGMITFNYSKGRKKFFVTWLISLFIVGGVCFFVIYSPFTIQDIANFFTKLWI